MGITISGENNNDRILATDGVIDQLSGFNVVGVITATSFTGDLTGDVTGNLTGNVTGNVTGNINNSTLLLQTGGSERIRITGNNEIGIAGANYGTSGQVLTSGGSGSAVSWTTISGTTINSNADNRIITGSGTANTLNGEANLTFDGSVFLLGNSTPKLQMNDGNGRIVELIGGSTSTGPELRTAYAGDLRFGTDSTEKLRITSGGTVQFKGDVNPQAEFDRGSANNTNINLKYNGTFTGQVSAANADFQLSAVGASTPISFYTDGDVRLRIKSDGNLTLGNIHGAKKVHISTSGNQKILIDPNYNNNSGGSSNSEADANNIVESILIRTSFGSNAASQTNAGHKWGIKFQGYNGNDFTQAAAKCAGVFAVSEDEATGYNKNVGLAFHTSPYNTAHREVMRINTNGIVTKPYHPVFSGRTNVQNNIVSGSGTIQFTADVNNGGHWSNSNYEFTCPVAGFYYMASSTLHNGETYLRYQKSPASGGGYSNISTHSFAYTPSSLGYNQISSMHVEQCAAGDKLRFQVAGSGANYYGQDHGSATIFLIG
tara:strand:- start:316 stop:1950 length:1635 start_codon:yes stop_codon:yes gene_type:complete